MKDLVFGKEGITLVYGEAATGKTTLAMQMSYEFSMKKRIIFIDSEGGFSLDRFKQIAGENYKDLLKKIFLLRVKNFEEQNKAILKLEDIKDCGLVIVDTIGMHYRVAVKEDYSDANNKLDKQMKILREISRNNIPVLITTQVYSNMDNTVKNIGGSMLKNWCSRIICLKKDPRKVILEKPEILEKSFDIRNEGLVI